MKGAIKIGRIAGIEISVHYTWILAFLLFTWLLASAFFPQSYPNWSAAAYWITGALAALLLFISVLIHEIAHSLVAKARGLPVKGITLFIFGGVSNIESEPDKPKVEFAMSIVGPLSSLVLAGILYGIFLLVPAQDSPLGAILRYLAIANAWLAAFNILPGFPLDGGRVLRSIIWGATGNLVRATNIATTVGQVFAWLFIGFGVFQLLAGNFLGGLWIAIIGWFQWRR
ncbi:MAG: site-2 protease family protein [Dehalococcoidales bacterium]|nr:site-2 protease family protein [Dehalococcoidales bacterium]